MSVAVTYREGDCWSVAELDEFSIAGVRPHVQYDIDTCDGEADAPGACDNTYCITVEHIPVTDMTIITYFNADGESRNWIAPTVLFVD